MTEKKKRELYGITELEILEAVMTIRVDKTKGGKLDLLKPWNLRKSHRAETQTFQEGAWAVGAGVSEGACWGWLCEGWRIGKMGTAAATRRNCYCQCGEMLLGRCLQKQKPA